MSMNDDIKEFPIFMVNRNGNLKQIYTIKSTDDYNHIAFELHHFIPKTIGKINKELYNRLKPMQRLFLLPKEVHQKLHGSAESFDYNGFKWYDLLFSRRKWKEGYYAKINNGS